MDDRVLIGKHVPPGAGLLERAAWPCIFDSLQPTRGSALPVTVCGAYIFGSWQGGEMGSW